MMKNTSTLFDVIADIQASEPWGHVLDAGTGSASLQWLMALPTDSWCAITGSEHMAEDMHSIATDKIRDQDKIVVGNWMDNDLLADEQFDTVIMDYLIGAMDGFSPYWQDRIFTRIKPLVKKKLYIIGLEPYVPYFPLDEEGKLICEIGRLRDACLLLAQERPYREYPADWMVRQLKLAGFNILDVQHFAIKYDVRFINSQLNMCRQRIERLPDRQLAESLAIHVEKLRQRALLYCEQQEGLRHGHDYIIAAELVP